MILIEWIIFNHDKILGSWTGAEFGIFLINYISSKVKIPFQQRYYSTFSCLLQFAFQAGLYDN